MTQIQLSDAQAVILATACPREGGTVFPVTTGLNGGAVGNVCKSLLKQGLIEEIAATDLNTVWRHNEERGPITLRATPLAYSSLGITDEQDETPPTETPTAPVQRRSGTKQEALIAMLRAEGRAAIKVGDAGRSRVMHKRQLWRAATQHRDAMRRARPGRLRHALLRIALQTRAPSCFHSASTGGGNANAAPEGGV